MHRGADADVGDHTHHDHGVDFEVLQCEVEIGVEECGIAALGNEDVVGARLEIIDHPRAPRALDAMRRPLQKLAVPAHVRPVAVGDEDDRSA